MQILLVSLAVVLLLLTIGAVWIRSAYLKYCAEMDAFDALQNSVSENERKIHELLSAFDRDFGGGLGGSISHNVRTKVEFSLSAIGTLPLEEQAPEADRLFKMTYETWERTKRNPDDVASITAPLSTFCKEIARRKIDILKNLAYED